MIQDVTDRIRMEEQLQQARKMESVGRLAGGVAHDLNNMLLPVLGYSELLMAELPEGELREEAEEIALAGGRARDLVRQLLAFARKQPLEVRPLDLSRVVEGFSKMLRRTIRENVVLKMDLCPVLPPVEGDAGQVEQILLNLAVNAQDAMPKGGTLFIETSPIELDRGYALEHVEILPGPYVLLLVSDTGSGMGTHVREHLFDPFFTTKGTGGTGLGLATVYGIVKQHGGGIQVYSEEGRGSTFRVYFPVCREAAGVSVSEGGSPVIGGRETLLVVEDQEQVRDLTCRVLRRQGYRVLEAADGASALRLAQEFPEPIDLLATDVVMPGMNGRELYDALRLSRPGLRVLYVSGYPGNVILHHGIMEEGGDFLSKPFSLVALAAKVREVLERRGPGVGSDQGETEGVRGRTRRGGP
jgi:nitrogen-specific signal transduction histidine kinase/CheY-like chemotaxis protein